MWISNCPKCGARLLHRREPELCSACRAAPAEPVAEAPPAPPPARAAPPEPEWEELPAKPSKLAGLFSVKKPAPKPAPKKK